MITTHTRQLRLQPLGPNDSFTLPDNWRFYSIAPTGDGVSITNDIPETITLNDGQSHSLYIVGESFFGVSFNTDANSTAIISYFL